MNETYIDLSEWIKESCESPLKEGGKDIHFDRFEKFVKNKLRGIDLLAYSISLLEKTFDLLKNIEREEIKPLIVLPLGYSKKMRKWHDKYLNDFGKADETPSLFLLEQNSIFENNCEEYRIPVCFSIKTKNKIFSLFRCDRSLDGLWDYCSCVYMYREGDFLG